MTGRSEATLGSDGGGSVAGDRESLSINTPDPHVIGNTS